MTTKELDKIAPSQKESIQIDSALEEKDGSCNDDENCESEDDEKSEPKKQMIEMSVALGNFDADPMVSSLLGNENDSDDASKNKERRAGGNNDFQSTGNILPDASLITFVNTRDDEDSSSNTNDGDTRIQDLQS